MLWFNRPPRKHLGSLSDGVDWHSHILPGIDDGVTTVDEALEILRFYEANGVREVWLTPHIMEDIPNTTTALRAKFEELKAIYEGNIRLRLGAEYMLDSLFDERLAEGDLLTIGLSGNRILIETSYFNRPIGMDDTINRVIQKGYIPVLAHPERYVYMDKDNYKRLKLKGVEFQMNILSQNNFYGKEARRKSLWLEKQGWYNYSGTDIHGVNMLKHLVD